MIRRSCRGRRLLALSLSPIFRAITGETLSASVQWLRLEHAALALVHHRDVRVLAVRRRAAVGMVVLEDRERRPPCTSP
jgi:hypothetical protein